MEETKMQETESQNDFARILTDAKQVINVMEEFKNELSILKNNLHEKENVYGDFENKLSALNEIHNQGILTLEINADNKNFIQENYDNYLTLAQSIYSSYNEMYKEIHGLKSKWDHIQEVTNTVEKNLVQKKEVLESKEKELQAIRNKQVEEEINEHINDENEFQILQMELQKIENELVLIDSNIDLKNLNLIRESSELSTKIDEMENILQITAALDEQLLRTSELFEKMNNEDLPDFTNSISDIRKPNNQMETENRQQENVIEELQDLNINLQNEINKIQHAHEIDELKNEDISKELNTINIQIVDLQEKTVEQIKCCSNTATKAQEKLLKMKQFREQLLKEITVLEENNKEECEEMERVVTNIEKGEKTISDLNVEIETVEVEYKDIEISSEAKEIQYENNLKDVQEKIEQAKLENLECKFNFQKQKQYVADNEKLLSQFQLEYKTVKEDMEKNKKVAESLKEEISKLKANKRDNRKNHQLNESIAKKPRNWDSDSDMETWASAKQNIKNIIHGDK